MPELPDIEVFSINLKKMFAGKQLTKIKVVNGKKLKDTQKDLSKQLEGAKVTDVTRSGKEMRFLFSNGVLLGVHLMLTGDLIPFEDKNERKSTIVELYFKGGKNLALTDRMKNAYVKLNPEDKAGVDALDTKLNFNFLKKALDRKANVKNVLLDQNVIRGIGNGYSDEILWETRISPFSVADAIPDEKIKELAKTIKKVLKNARDKILKNYPGLVHGEVRDYMKIHSKKLTESPTGAKIKLADRGMLKTYYTEEQVLYV
ncbi:MAG: Fpg/Nei family DNA glycosylase [Gammaproteobacteria bacterium]|nr:MAG: Fpg/Nei family DNA glycosylase [Gammaproteobacteria bacterium]